MIKGGKNVKELIRNLRIRAKIMIIVIISIAALIGLGILSLVFLNKVNQGSTDISKGWLPSVICAEELNTLTSDYRIQEYKHIISITASSMEEISKEMEKINADIQEKFTEYETTLITNDTDKALITSAKTGWDSYLQLSSEMLAKSTDNKTDEAMAIVNSESAELFNTISDTFLKLVEFNKSGSDEASITGDNLYGSAFAIILGSGIAIIIITLILSLVVSSAITKPLSEIDTVAQKIANEQMNTSITYISKDELGNLSQSFNKTVSRLKNYMNYINEIANVLAEIADGNLNFTLEYDYTGEFSKVKQGLVAISDNLNDTLSKINQSADLVSSSSAQMAEGAQSLAEGATDQAGTVEELVATIQDVSEKIRQNAEEAEGANQLVKQTKEEIERSNTQMKHMIEAMSQINEKSQQIVNIVASIEDISSQTNLLALNAAIEAARAGDAGKGFAVVAEQVKVLAAQSAEAAKNTVELINSSIQAVENGTTIANETADSLIGVVSTVEEASGTMTGITSASKEQAEFMGQVEEGVENIANVVQNNSATAQESSATSEELSSQAQVLKEMVSKFVLKA